MERIYRMPLSVWVCVREREVVEGETQDKDSERQEDMVRVRVSVCQ